MLDVCSLSMATNKVRGKGKRGFV